MLKLIIYILLIYLVFRVMTRYVFPYLVKLYLNSVKKKFYEQNPHYKQYHQQKRKKEGEVTIEHLHKKERKPSTDDVGEYIDYEDVKGEDKESESHQR